MRVVSLHPDVLVATSAAWQTNCVVVRSGAAIEAASDVPESELGADGPPAEGFVIDSPIFPQELELLPTLLQQARFPFTGLLVTHADWDHLLGRLAFPGAPIGCAETTAARLRAEPGAAARDLRAFDDEHYVERAAPLQLGDAQALPVPGHLEVGPHELELHPTEGHVVDGMAILVGWAGVLVCGDFLSPCEIPMLGEGAGGVEAYRSTLRRLAPLVDAATHVVPGHGAVMDSTRAAAILREDDAYLEALAQRGADAPLPLARRGAAQKEIHARNAALVGDGPRP
jgi:glyoxylase-like metal-dependent hydrolase (beta-lactamase superfamily II)